MINKEKTIRKMRARYHEIFPIPGKRDLHDCFFCLHGQIVIQFRTKDKKVHVQKACLELPRQQPPLIFNTHFFGQIRRILNQPIRFGTSTSRG